MLAFNLFQTSKLIEVQDPLVGIIMGLECY